MQSQKHRKCMALVYSFFNSFCDLNEIHDPNIIDDNLYTICFRYVTHDDIQQARLKRRRRRKTAPSNPETLRSSNNVSNDSLWNPSEAGSSTSHDKTLPAGCKASFRCAAAAFGINTSLLYDTFELSHINRRGSICSFDRFRVYRIKIIAKT